MKVFILEDDSNCFGVIDWLKKNHKVTHVKNIEEAVTCIDYQKQSFDKYIFDASLPSAKVKYKDKTRRQYNGALNGIDLLADNFQKWGFDTTAHNIAILTAFEMATKQYSRVQNFNGTVEIISKYDNDLIEALQKFLDA